VVFLNVNKENPQAHRITVVALPASTQGIVFSTSNGGTLLASSSKDNTRIELVRVEMDSYGF
jgi:hypothetical protein